MGELIPLNDVERAELVAYLDGELDEQTARSVEARLHRDLEDSPGYFPSHRKRRQSGPETSAGGLAEAYVQGRQMARFCGRCHQPRARRKAQGRDATGAEQTGALRTARPGSRPSTIASR